MKIMVKIGLVQQRATADPNENLEKAIAGIQAAAQQGAQVVCLQELVATPYIATREDPTRFSYAETIPGKTTERLSKAARENKVTLIGGSLVEKVRHKRKEQYFNTAVIFNQEGALEGIYRKTHIPHDPHYWEQYYFTPGNSSYKVFETPHAKIGVLICYDQWFPEPARILALEGAQILFYPTAIGWTKEMRRKEKEADKRWVDVQRAHAIENHVYVAAVNRVGEEDNAIKFWGQSFLADPFGEVVARASKFKEQVIVAHCNLDKIRQAQSWRFMENRRPDTYGRLLQ